eukprot:NODE_1066_length_2624_cov_4.631958.p2 GENE.NODE_1066_length_2624_cov_4.631958~~NODE_1066_length_2624_cov_4.631958.p2  ORF type:complete len:510 (-),score=177.78 NODE_1066_length_2624_cov_4.631958:815-2344(-)
MAVMATSATVSAALATAATATAVTPAGAEAVLWYDSAAVFFTQESTIKIMIWFVRILVPILAFLVYLWIQSARDEQAATPEKYSHPRSKMIACRRVVLREMLEVPPCMSNLRLVDEATAPTLFLSNSRPVRKRDERASKERKEKRESRKSEKKDGDDEAAVAAPTVSLDTYDSERVVGIDTASIGAADVGDARIDATDAARSIISANADAAEVNNGQDDKMHLESLLNYVAFNRKEQLRTFILEEEGAAPPPPPPPLRTSGSGAAPAIASAEASEKANDEAQMVLRGAISFKPSQNLANNLYEQLIDSKVEISETTFTLMIESCILARDLKSSSDFLMKMEASGYCLEAEMLDKVMELYSQEKVARDNDQLEAKALEEVHDADAAELAANLAGLASLGGRGDPDGFGALEEFAAPTADQPRVKLSSDAAIFVPMHVPPPPPAPLPPPPPPPPAAVGTGIDEEQMAAPPPRRTALSASARPFNPVEADAGGGGGEWQSEFRWRGHSAIRT